MKVFFLLFEVVCIKVNTSKKYDISINTLVQFFCHFLEVDWIKINIDGAARGAPDLQLVEVFSRTTMMIM